MTVTETLEKVQFVVGADGQPTAAVLDMPTYQSLVALLEDAEDMGLLRGYLERRRTARTPAERGLIAWEQAEAILDAREHDDATVD